MLRARLETQPACRSSQISNVKNPSPRKTYALKRIRTSPNSMQNHCTRLAVGLLSSPVRGYRPDPVLHPDYGGGKSHAPPPDPDLISPHLVSFCTYRSQPFVLGWY